MPSMFESIEKEVAMTVAKARENACWFCNKRYEDWMTPEEFEMLFKVHRISYGENDRTLLDNYRMLDPRVGIRYRINIANKATADLQEFSDRVFAYFNQVPRDKR